MCAMPFGLTCDDCGAILREFRNAVEQDEQGLRSRLHPAADASGREPDEMRLAWVSSIANMPTDEMCKIMRAQYPRLADIRRKQAEHESAQEPVAPRLNYTSASDFSEYWRGTRAVFDPQIVRRRRNCFVLF